MATIRSQLSVIALVSVITILFGLFVWATLTGRINFLAAVGPRLYLDPVNKLSQTDETVPLTLRIDSDGKNVVAATADISYTNSDLSLLSISPSGDSATGTVFRYSIEEKQDTGSIRITRGAPGNGNADDSVGGFMGRDGTFATLNFKVLRAVTTSVILNKTTSALIADDGNGTNILNATDGATIHIQGPKPPTPSTGCNPSTNHSDYDYAWIRQNAFPTHKRGEKYQFEVKIKNVGVRTWEKDKLNLGTDRPRDRVPGFLREGGDPSGWLKENRVEMVESAVAPGETATFRFWYTVPPGKPFGSYKEYFRPVAEFITWLEPDQGIYWDVTVAP